MKEKFKRHAIYSNASTYISSCIKSLPRNNFSYFISPLRRFRSFWWIATYSRRNWVTRKMCRIISSLAFILNGKHDDKFLIQEIFLHILKIFLYIFVYIREYRQRIGDEWNETVLLHFCFAYFSHTCTFREIDTTIVVDNIQVIICELTKYKLHFYYLICNRVCN